MDSSLVDDLMKMRIKPQASVLITSRDDLKLSENPALDGIDLVVSIIKNRGASGRQFGVILHAHIQKYASLQEAAEILDAMMDGRDGFDPGPTPICIFSFVMTGREGVYPWLFEPTIGKRGPVIRHREPLACRDLDKTSLAAIVKQVDQYYEALTGANGDS